MTPGRSYLVCSTPRSGSTLVCQALAQSGVAGRPEEYFEAPPHSGRPRRPEEYFHGVTDTSILDHLTERGIGDDPPQRSPLWSRTACDRYLEWVFASKLEPPLKQQSDSINDDWVLRYSELKLGAEFDLTSAVAV